MTAVFVTTGVAQPRLDKLNSTTKTGTVVIPRNFPKQTADDLQDMFRANRELGSFAVVRLNWNDLNLDAARILVAMGYQASLDAVVELSPFKANGLKGASLEPAKGVPSGSFTNSAVADAFRKAVLDLAALRPPYLAVATDVNLYAQSDSAGFKAFANLYRGLYGEIKRVSPDTKIFVTFQWDAMQRQSAAETRWLIDAFGPNLDVFAVTSAPRQLFSDGPGAIPGDYYSRVSAYQHGRRPIFLEVNWPSEGRNGEADQAAFIRTLPRFVGRLEPSMLAWTFLHDVRIMLFTIRAGLRSANGTPKPAFAAFRDISQDRSSPARSADSTTGAPAPSSTAPASKAPAYFGVYTARLDGSGVQTIITNEYLEMTHPRVSPDGQRIVITRYNAKGPDGRAIEDRGYEFTEIMILNIDGTGLESVIPGKPGILAANGCWTPDGRSLIYISTDNPQRKPEIRQVELSTRKITRVPTPAGLSASDPHWEGNLIVFAVKGEGNDTLWTMNADGSNARQVTRHTQTRKRGSAESYGDFDPKLSPDGTKVAFMRIFGGTGWRAMLLDLKTGQERNFTPDGVIEGLPVWSSDGRLLMYRHIDLAKPRETGLYTMTPEGNNRKMVPLPRGLLYNHATFFPGDGSSPNARIIYEGTKVPGF